MESQAVGTLTVGEATARSVNCAYARLIKLLRPEKVDVAHRMGIAKPLRAHLSLALGSEPVTPLQMAAGYATLAGGGVRHDPSFVGGAYPARIFGEYMWSVRAEQPTVPFPAPEPPARDSNSL